MSPKARSSLSRRSEKDFAPYHHLLILVVFRYFFHATENSKTEPEYDADTDGSETEGSETEPEDEEFQVPPPPAATTSSRAVDESQLDPSLADWFHVENKEVESEKAVPDDDSETEPESDNMDTLDVDADVEDDDDDWYNFETAQVIVDPLGHTCPNAIHCRNSLRVKSDQRVKPSPKSRKMSRWVKMTLRWNMIKNSFSSICMYLDHTASAYPN